MATQSAESDVGLGLTVLFALVALVGAGAMLAAPGQVAKAWGFALAVSAGVLSVAAAQVYA